MQSSSRSNCKCIHKSKGVPLKNGCISLVVRNASDGAGQYAQFVHWFNVGVCEAKVFKFGPRNRIIYNIPAFTTTQTIDIANVVVASVPDVVMIARKGYEADTIPDWCMFWKERLDAEQCCGPFASIDIKRKCVCVVFVCQA